ncbi:MAG: tetratricopeptide repeat protein [Gammaproteobacteria bacterium]|nr:tetratricopeptide repeat protein [Gammaproteobacteria bacterium]
MKKQLTASKYNALLNAAIKHQNTGQFLEAKSIYTKLLEHNHADSNVLFLLGSLYGQMGELKNCINSLTQSLQINDKQIDAYNNLAIAYELTNQFESAIHIYEKAMQLSPNSPHIHGNLGDVFRKIGNYEKSLFHLNIALNISPDNEATLLNKANLLGQMNKNNEARQVYQHALSLYPNNITLLSNFSALLQIENDFTQAEILIRKALSLKHDYPQALSNLANILIKQEKFSEAEEHLLKAISLNPAYTEAYINLGFLYHSIALFDKAIDCFNKAIELEPESITGHWYRTFTLLLTGKFDNAWDDYEYRFKSTEHINDPYDYPNFNIELKNEDVLLVTAEQGIGDQVMFASCLPDLLKLTDTAIIECDKRLLPLFKRAFPSNTVIFRGQYDKESIKKTFPSIRKKLAIGSLPRLFRKNISQFPKTSPYLGVDEEKYKKWKDRYKILGNKLNIGISWKGGTRIEQKKRSIPLDAWKEILQCDCNFINLQYGNNADELIAFENNYGITIHDWEDSDSLKDLDDFSAQIAALDLVISVGNTNVHLAGSLNVPALCLIPKVPSWRWLFSGEECLWYPSVNIFRQADLHEWQPVLKNIEQALKKYITKNKN